jgi:hypothetical protein
MTTHITRHLRASHHKIVGEHAFPQLNQAETKEMESFLVWLLKGKSNDYSALSAIVFAVAVAIEKAGVKLRTDGERSYETEPFVHYSESHLNLSGVDGHASEAREHFRLENSVIGRSQQIAYPRDEPSSMIYSVPANRRTINSMIHFWEPGSKAASKMNLHAKGFLPLALQPNIYYTLENCDPEKSSFSNDIIIIVNRAFPDRSESILLAVEDLMEPYSATDLTGFLQYTELRYLKQREGIAKPKHMASMDLLWQYQALVFGFYYALMDSLISTKLVQKNAYFRGLWGRGSTMFLGMCIEFADLLRREGLVSRTHVLYMLSTMYNARQKQFPDLSAAKGLLGVLGSISVLSGSLMRTTDDPKEISKFALTDLPILDLMADYDGELFAGKGGGFPFNDYNHAKPTVVQPRGPKKEWSLHAKMGLLFGDGEPGVVMAARCAGTLVGWFSPLAADIAFLSSAYQERSHDGEEGYIDQSTFMGYEVDDSHWQENRLSRPMNQRVSCHVGLVRSSGCPALRYTAAGILTEYGEEIAIATDDINAAYDKVAEQGEGIVIA